MEKGANFYMLQNVWAPAVLQLGSIILETRFTYCFGHGNSFINCTWNWYWQHFLPGFSATDSLPWSCSPIISSVLWNYLCQFKNNTVCNRTLTLLHNEGTNYRAAQIYSKPSELLCLLWMIISFMCPDGRIRLLTSAICVQLVPYHRILTTDCKTSDSTGDTCAGKETECFSLWIYAVESYWIKNPNIARWMTFFS